MSERREGWYWVKTSSGNDWLAGYWNDEYRKWNVMARVIDDDKLHEIGSRIPTPDEPWKTVPVEPSEEMCDSVRGFLLMLSMSSDINYERLRKGLKMRGESGLIESLPEYAKTGEGHIPKSAQADIIFRLMSAAAPKPGDDT